MLGLIVAIGYSATAERRDSFYLPTDVLLRLPGLSARRQLADQRKRILIDPASDRRHCPKSIVKRTVHLGVTEVPEHII